MPRQPASEQRDHGGDQPALEDRARRHDQAEAVRRGDHGKVLEAHVGDPPGRSETISYARKQSAAASTGMQLEWHKSGPRGFEPTTLCM